MTTESMEGLNAVTSNQSSLRCDLDKYYDSNQMPCQISKNEEDRKDSQKTIESQLEYSADKIYQSYKSSSRGADDKKFDEGFFKRELKEMQERCLENQRTMQRIENKYFRSKSQSQSQNSSHTSSTQFQPDEKTDNDLFIQQDTKYNLECEVSEINKNMSINQDLSLLNCERAIQMCTEEKNQDLEHKVRVLMSENLKLSQINQTLFTEVEHLKDSGPKNSHVTKLESREIILRNTQITELQRRVFEAERGQVEKMSEDHAQTQCLERKVQQLNEQNQILVRQVERYKLELHQSQAQIDGLAENNAQMDQQMMRLQKNEGYMDTDREEYQRLKIEFEEFQRLTQNIINQEEDCQRRICEQDEELSQQIIIQEELVGRIRDSDAIYQQKIYEMKQSFQSEFEAAIHRMQEQNQNLRDQNQYLFDQLQSYEIDKQNIEEYFLNEIETIKQQCQQKYVSMEQQLKIAYEKQLQEKNTMISQMQDQSQYQIDMSSDIASRSKSLSACNGINKLAGMLQSSKINQNYYLPPYRANISLEEDHYGRVKQNNSYHNSGTQAAAQNLNTSLTYQKKATMQQNYNKNLSQQKSNQKQNVEKENIRDWEKSALLLSQKKQKDQFYRESYSKQKTTNLQLRQLDGDFKFSMPINGSESRSNNVSTTNNNSMNSNNIITSNPSSNTNFNTNNRYANIYSKNQYQNNDNRTSLPTKILKK